MTPACLYGPGLDCFVCLFHLPSQVRPFTKEEKFPSTCSMPGIVSFLDSANGR